MRMNRKNRTRGVNSGGGVVKMLETESFFGSSDLIFLWQVKRRGWGRDISS